MAFNVNNCGAIREFQSVGQQIDKHLLKPDLIQSDRYVWTRTIEFDTHFLKLSLTIKDEHRILYRFIKFEVLIVWSEHMHVNQVFVKQQLNL